MVTYRNTRGRNGGSRVTLLLLLVPRVTKGWRNPGIPAKLESPWSFLLGRSFCSSTLFRQQETRNNFASFLSYTIHLHLPSIVLSWCTQRVNKFLRRIWRVDDFLWIEINCVKFDWHKNWLKLIYRTIGQLFCIS